MSTDKARTPVTPQRVREIADRCGYHSPTCWCASCENMRKDLRQLADQLERDAEVLKQRDDALERIIQLEDEYKYTRAAIREGLSEVENVAYPVTREKAIFIRLQRDELRWKLAGAKRLQELTLQNELRWMRKHEDLLNLIASLRDWKSPDGVLQVKDLKWFKDLPKPLEAKC